MPRPDGDCASRLDPHLERSQFRFAAPRNETDNSLHPVNIADQRADGRVATGSTVGRGATRAGRHVGPLHNRPSHGRGEGPAGTRKDCTIVSTRLSLFPASLVARSVPSCIAQEGEQSHSKIRTCPPFAPVTIIWPLGPWVTWACPVSVAAAASSRVRAAAACAFALAGVTLPTARPPLP